MINKTFTSLANLVRAIPLSFRAIMFLIGVNEFVDWVKRHITKDDDIETGDVRVDSLTNSHIDTGISGPYKRGTTYRSGNIKVGKMTSGSINTGFTFT